MSRRPRAPEVANAVRDAMIDAATRVFAQRGFVAATMKEIASEAGYTAPAFYNYFGGKEQLYEALLERTFDEIIATLDEPAPPPAGFTARLDALMRRQFALADRRTDTFRVLMSVQVAAPEPPPDAGVRQFPPGYLRLMTLLGAWFARASKGAAIASFDPSEAAMVYLSITQAYHFRWMSERPAEPFVHQVERVRDVFLRGVFGVGAPKPRPRRAADRSPRVMLKKKGPGAKRGESVARVRRSGK